MHVIYENILQYRVSHTSWPASWPASCSLGPRLGEQRLARGKCVPKALALVFVVCADIIEVVFLLNFKKCVQKASLNIPDHPRRSLLLEGPLLGLLGPRLGEHDRPGELQRLARGLRCVRPLHERRQSCGRSQ